MDSLSSASQNPFEDRATEWLARLSGKPELTLSERKRVEWGILDGTTVLSSVSPRASASRSAAIQAGIQGVPFLWFVSLGTQRNEPIGSWERTFPLWVSKRMNKPVFGTEKIT